MLAPLPRRLLAAATYGVLVQAIVTGTLAAGARIRHGEVQAQLHISRASRRARRSSVRDPKGSVESVAKRDTRVAPIRAERVAQAILVIAALQAPGPRIGHVTVQPGGRVCADCPSVASWRPSSQVSPGGSA